MDPKHHILTPDKAFVCISLFNQLRAPLTLFPYTFKSTIDMVVSFGRIVKFLDAEEIYPLKSITACQPRNEMHAIEVKKASFSWNHSEKIPTLRSIDINLPKNPLTAIVGMVGSGKDT